MSVIFTAPDAPSITSASNVRTQSLMIKWNHPVIGETTKYRVLYTTTDGPGQSVDTEDTSVTELNIDSLTANTEYTFKVIAIVSDDDGMPDENDVQSDDSTELVVKTGNLSLNF